MNIYVNLVILTTKSKNIDHLKQNFSESKIHLARKIRTDILSLYRKICSLGAPYNFKLYSPLTSFFSVRYLLS